jgi:hypothetical protein
MPPKQQSGGQPVDQVSQFMSMPIPLPYAILLMLLGTGGSGAVGALTRDGDIEAVKAAITAQQSEERAHYSEVMATLRAVNERLDRLETRINQKENDR